MHFVNANVERRVGLKEERSMTGKAATPVGHAVENLTEA
jgi:hypothetical protein